MIRTSLRLFVDQIELLRNAYGVESLIDGLAETDRPGFARNTPVCVGNGRRHRNIFQMLPGAFGTYQ